MLHRLVGTVVRWFLRATGYPRTLPVRRHLTFPDGVELSDTAAGDAPEIWTMISRIMTLMGLHEGT
jgi:hypothetical protein